LSLTYSCLRRGKTIWGSDSDKAAVANDLQLIRNNFTDVPLMIGEFGASPVNTEPAARWKYINYLMHTAVEHDIARVLWDNGAGWLDRATGIWRDPVGIEMIVETTASTAHSLPDSTTDSSATSQWSSAYIFHQVGTPLTSQSLPFIFNGNTLSSITDSKGTVLASGSDYTVSEPNITFSESYLSKHLSPSTDPGILENLTLDFSAGASPITKIVQWSTPTLSSTSAAASSVNGSDLAIPIAWAGIPKPAAVKAIMADGTIAFSEWTKYLGPLQQGRAVSHQHSPSSDVGVLL
jgi:endoglucanase